MKTKIVISMIAIVTCFALGWSNSQRVLQSIHSGPVQVKAHAQWSSSAGTVAQQMEEADAVVRAHVKRLLKPRIFETPLTGQLDRRFPRKFDVVVFTEALLQVDKVFHGEVPNLIRVVQTGGLVPENDHHSALRVEMYDDPLLVRGGEYILFLKEISGDPKLAPNGRAYRIVNSAGRYDISGNKVVSYSDISGKRPTRLADLRAQMRGNG